jgi:hypothetical protein
MPCPVSIEARARVHDGAEQKALVKRMPSPATRSMVGVRTTGSPQLPM